VLKTLQNIGVNNVLERTHGRTHGRTRQNHYVSGHTTLGGGIIKIFTCCFPPYILISMHHSCLTRSRCNANISIHNATVATKAKV